MIVTTPEEATEMAKRLIRARVRDTAYKIFLFGSRATGRAHERSDIDIGIEGPAPVSDDILIDIRDELEESPTLYSVEVVDFARVPQKFRAVARERVAL